MTKTIQHMLKIAVFGERRLTRSQENLMANTSRAQTETANLYRNML